MRKFQEAVPILPSQKEFRKVVIAAGGTKAEADAARRKLKNQETWVNGEFVVSVNREHPHGFGDLPGGMFELSIRRDDRGPIRDWRKLQQIKNEIIGPEHEAVELYPAESRLRDAANQYWLYGFNNPDARFPFGMWGRAVADNVDFLNAQQRDFDS